MSAESWLRGLCVFWLVVYLLPLWIARYIPTEDGASHLYNAVLLKDLARPGTRYAEFFERRDELVPNLASHALLATFMHFVSPLTAEKLLASIYVISFVLAFRYLLCGVAAERGYWTVGALLFVYNGSFWYGFYNYCLSSVLFLVTMGYCMRRREHFGAASAMGLCVLLLLTYLTHLVGFLLAIAGAIWLAVTVPSRRATTTLYTLAAVALPTFLAVEFFFRTGFFGKDQGSGLMAQHIGYFFTNAGSEWEKSLLVLDTHLFGTARGCVRGLAILLLFQMILLVSLLRPKHGSRVSWTRSLPLALLAVFIAALYCLLPDSLGKHGAVLQTRLAFLPLMLWLACLSPPSRLVTRWMVQCGLCVALTLNVSAAIQYVVQANEDLAEFTAAIPYVRHDVTLSLIDRRIQPQLMDYLGSASAYYCLTNGNVWLDNYEASTAHFPIRFRIDSGEVTALQHAPQMMLKWSDPPDEPYLPPAYREIYSGRRLHVYELLTLRDN